MSIKICDALCGSGKTSACIRMMNEDAGSKFIFVTQFLSEVDRIKAACSSKGFVSPDNDPEARKTKLADIKRLLREGCNIATTHALFLSCTDEIKDLVRDQHYVLVLDETVDLFHMSGLKTCDMNMLIHSKIVEEEEGSIRWVYEEYEKEDYDGEGKFSHEVLLSKSKNLLKFGDEYFFWMLPPELFECFHDVYILTYLFHAQLLRCFFEVYEIAYEFVGVRFTEGEYRFCDPGEMDRRRDLRNKIHILEHDKLNEVGDLRSDLSVSSYALRKHREGEGLAERIRKNLVNVFRNVYHAPSDQIMWTVFKDFKGAVAAKGFTNSFVPYNKRASNEYSNRRYLAYCVNNFLRPWEVRYYKEHGVFVDQDSYALSILVQWVFRSAIRNGEEVWLYVPSARMRSLLKQWLENLAEGRDLDPVVYVPEETIGFERGRRSVKYGRNPVDPDPAG